MRAARLSACCCSQQGVSCAEGLIPAARSSVWNGHFTLRASSGHVQGAGRGTTGGTGGEPPGGGWVCTCRGSLWWSGGGGEE